MRKFTRRNVLIAASASAGVAVDRYVLLPNVNAGPSFPVDVVSLSKTDLILNDASELCPTSVSKHVVIHEDPNVLMVNRLRGHLKEAREAKRSIVASAARHSMGGQSMPQNGIAVTMDQRWVELDKAAKTYRVAAGTRWSNVISALDVAGFSPTVMQSNNDFGVASTFSVNAHGWPVPFSGCGSTVRSIQMMLADGSMVSCSRTNNTELFNHAMGGYGLFGIITEVELDMVANSLLEPTFESMPGRDVGNRFAEVLKQDPSIQMAYGRLDVSLDRFFDQGLLVTYRPVSDQSNIPPASGSGFISHASRAIFRNQVGFDRGKHMRWFSESEIGPKLAGQATRNSLLNEPVITLDDNDPSRTDILHEYFVSPDRFNDFVDICRDVIPASYQQLLNVTLRYVNTDHDSVLAYASQPRIASVMLFSQEKSQRGEIDMARMTHRLIEQVLGIGGAYYLPYRPHATLDQLQKSYPRAAEFSNRKRELDKNLVFQNRLWRDYLARL